MDRWNKGKNKYNDERIKRQSISLHQSYEDGKISKHMPNWKGRHHSEKTKEKIRQARINYLKKHNKISTFTNRIQRKMSYGEMLLHNVFLENKIYEKYLIINEYCEFPYIIDFAFINEKVAVEYDGEMHFKNGKERFQHDIKKDEYLKYLGWRIYRIPYFEFKNFKIDDLILFLGNSHIQNDYINTNTYIKYKDFKKQQIEKINKRKEQLYKLKISSVEDLKENIKNSNIDFYKFGWVNKVSLIIKCSPQHVNRWMKKNMPEFYEKCYKRKNVT